MHIDKFYDKINDHQRLDIIDIVKGDKPSEDYFIVKDNHGDGKFKVMVAAVLQNDWNVIEEILTGQRQPLVLEHMTRIVGYYSKVKNWNRSKLGELRDRQAGDYSITGSAPKPHAERCPEPAVERGDMLLTA